VVPGAHRHWSTGDQEDHQGDTRSALKSGLSATKRTQERTEAELPATKRTTDQGGIRSAPTLGDLRPRGPPRCTRSALTPDDLRPGEPREVCYQKRANTR
jgi:hypothetical protein